MSTSANYSRATIITIYSLGVFLGLLHIFLGVIALTPILTNDYHREVKINFNAFAKSATFLHQFIDRASLAIYSRQLVGLMEIVFGALLLENGHFGSFGKFGNFGLIGTNILYLLIQITIGSAYERIAPTIVFAVLLITRLLIVKQSAKKQKVGVKTRNAGKPKTSTPKKNKNE